MRGRERGTEKEIADRSANTSAQKCDRAIIACELISPIQNPGNELICAPNNSARKQIYEAHVDSLGNAYNCFMAECRRIILRIVTRRAESRNARAFTCPESRLINAGRTRNSCVLSRNVTPVTAREIRKRSRNVLAGRIPMCAVARLYLARAIAITFLRIGGKINVPRTFVSLINFIARSYNLIFSLIVYVCLEKSWYCASADIHFYFSCIFFSILYVLVY